MVSIVDDTIKRAPTDLIVVILYSGPAGNP